MLYDSKYFIILDVYFIFRHTGVILINLLNQRKQSEGFGLQGKFLTLICSYV